MREGERGRERNNERERERVSEREREKGGGGKRVLLAVLHSGRE